ncbi:MAG: CHAT domain-containing protein [Candidatus Competibacter sp.]
MEALPGLVKIHVLDPPTLPALRDELDRARTEQKRPYHVVHFDGHGVYDRRVGLGGLCFEHPQDTGQLEKRRHATVFTDELGPLLRDHRIPLVFLEACQTAQAEQASESVASELLKVGVASVVAMSHSVLVETARRFVATFYRALAAGKRVGDAMLAGQRALKDDTFRGRIFGAGEFRLEDWFVPVLFQEKDDPQLFKMAPAKQTVADFQKQLAARLGELPPEPETGFVGRSRELLALQRLLFSPLPSGEGPGVRGRPYAVIRGQGGEGKTALAAEFARWLVRSQQVRRAVFVSVEMHGHVQAVLDALGRQLVGKNYSVATFPDLEQAILPVERALVEQPTLLVVDNMESVLLPPFLAEDTPEALDEDLRRELDAILKLCARLNGKGDTRLVFTSREALPAPFDGPAEPAGTAPTRPRGRGEAGRAGAERRFHPEPSPSGRGQGEGIGRRPRGDRATGGRGSLPRPHPGAAGSGAAGARRRSHPRIAGRADGGDGAALPRQPGAVGLRQRRTVPATPVGGEPGAGARARGVSRRGRSGRARHDDAVGKGGLWPRWRASWSRRGWRRRIATTISPSIPRSAPTCAGGWTRRSMRR